MLLVITIKGILLLFICCFILKAHADIIFKPNQAQIYRTTFTSYLLVDPPATTQSVSLSCQASVVDSIDLVQNLVENPDCSFTSSVTVATTQTPAISTPPDPSSPWRVVNSRFDIPESLAGTGQSYQFLAVTTERVLDPIAEQVEIVLTTCCVLDSSSNPNYNGQSVVAVAVATTAPYFCANCNDTITNPLSERTIQNPGYVEFGPCPCDLTQSQCDFNCGCDADCTENDKARFKSVVAGVLGGQELEPDYSCDTKSFNRPDWHVLTCVYWESNAYLGHYFMNKPKLSSSIDFTAASQLYRRHKFSLAETGSRTGDKDFSSQYYQQGLIIQTRPVSYPSSSGTLSLPRSISGSACNPLTPVRFLLPFESSCSVELTTASCSALSVFSAEVYAMSNDTATNFKILNKFKGGSPIASEVRYYCLSDYTAYRSLSATALGSQDPNTVQNFDNSLLNEDCSNTCDNPACWQYNTDRSFPQSYPLPPECTPTSLEPSLTATTCNNVVLDVRYTFEWSGTEIRRLVASVFLADVARTDMPQTLAQKFSVEWQHLLNVTNPPLSDNFLNASSAYARSGSAGYEIGKPLYSGCSTKNSTTGEFPPVDTGDEKQLAVWRPGVDGLCTGARREFTTFGDDFMSSCALRLDFDQLNNSCVELRKLVTDHLNILMPANVVGRYGYNNPGDEEMWIPVLRQNLSAVEIPSDAPINVNTTDNSTVFRLADDISGVCFLPTAINLHILYAQTGAVFGYPRYEIVGAFVNYTHSNWSMECTGANSRRCDASSGLVQNFFLHSSVHFTRIPPVAQTQESKFYTRFASQACETDTCLRYREFFATAECYYDSCWQELAYPLTSVYEGDSHEYALSFFLLLVLGIVGYASVTKPGWS